MTRWTCRSWTSTAIPLVGLGVAVFQAFLLAGLPEASPQLIAAEAALVAAFCLLGLFAARDARQRRRLEAQVQRYHDIAAASVDWLWETGPDLRFSYLLAPAARAAGENPTPPFRIGETVPESWRQRLGETAPRSFRNLVCSVPQASGQPLLFKATGVPIFDAAGRFRGYRGIASNVTGDSLAECKARWLETDLMRAQQMETLTAFAAGIAHDVNNALLPVLTMIRSLMRRLDSESREHEKLALAFEAAQRCRDLVSAQLSLIQRENAGDIAIDLKAPVTDAIEMLRRGLPPGIRLTAEIEPVPMPVVSAPVKILQIVANLVANATKAIGNRPLGGEIAIRLAASADLDGYLLEVADDGPGIAPELQEKIFEPFFSNQSAEGGKGLGLPSVLSLARGLGGKVSVLSRVGKGARFIVFLPRPAENPEANLAD